MRSVRRNILSPVIALVYIEVSVARLNMLHVSQVAPLWCQTGLCPVEFGNWHSSSFSEQWETSCAIMMVGAAQRFPEFPAVLMVRLLQLQFLWVISVPVLQPSSCAFSKRCSSTMDHCANDYISHTQTACERGDGGNARCFILYHEISWILWEPLEDVLKLYFANVSYEASIPPSTIVKFEGKTQYSEQVNSQACTDGMILFHWRHWPI